MDGKIKIELEKRIDSQGKNYLIGKIKSPIVIDCEKGVCFLVFYSETNCEELQIAPLETPVKKVKTPKVYKSIKKVNADD